MLRNCYLNIKLWLTNSLVFFAIILIILDKNSRGHRNGASREVRIKIFQLFDIQEIERIKTTYTIESGTEWENLFCLSENLVFLIKFCPSFKPNMQREEMHVMRELYEHYLKVKKPTDLFAIYKSFQILIINKTESSWLNIRVLLLRKFILHGF